MLAVKVALEMAPLVGEIRASILGLDRSQLFYRSDFTLSYCPGSKSIKPDALSSDGSVANKPVQRAGSNK